MNRIRALFASAMLIVLLVGVAPVSANQECSPTLPSCGNAFVGLWRPVVSTVRPGVMSTMLLGGSVAINAPGTQSVWVGVVGSKALDIIQLGVKREANGQVPLYRFFYAYGNGDPGTGTYVENNFATCTWRDGTGSFTADNAAFIFRLYRERPTSTDPYRWRMVILRLVGTVYENCTIFIPDTFRTWTPTEVQITGEMEYPNYQHLGGTSASAMNSYNTTVLVPSGDTLGSWVQKKDYGCNCAFFAEVGDPKPYPAGGLISFNYNWYANDPTGNIGGFWAKDLAE